MAGPAETTPGRFHPEDGTRPAKTVFPAGHVAVAVDELAALVPVTTVRLATPLGPVAPVLPVSPLALVTALLGGLLSGH